MTGFTITVPASTANIGPGFDSAGMALSKYLTLYVESNDEWVFEHHSPHLPDVPVATEHFIYQIAANVAKQYDAVLPGAYVKMESDIPLARGLGSSSSAIIAGIELADQLCDLSLSVSAKLQIASAFEGHPDNVAPSLLGGLVIAAQSADGDLDYLRFEHDDLDIIAYIPHFELKTEAARSVLPNEYLRGDAVGASAIANVMFASLVTGNYPLAGKMMEKDLFHEPHRANLLPDYENIRLEARNAGAYGTAISGAGPTMMSLAPKGSGATIAKRLQAILPDYTVEVLQMDKVGSRVKKGISVK